MIVNMNAYKIRFSKTVLFVIGILLICLNIFFLILQNTKDLALGNEENRSSYINPHPRQDKEFNGTEVVEINDKANAKMKDKHIDMSTVKYRTVWNHLPPGTQMGELQVAAIRKVISSNSNVLVWGLGNDSPFWHDSTRGRVVFIEPAGFWYNTIIDTYPYLEAYTVKYSTDNEKSFDKYVYNPETWQELDIRPQLPDKIIHTYWNVIIVDAPPGYKGAPGRYQSIYTSSLLARNGTHIFVDDYERKVERVVSNKMLGVPIDVVNRPRKANIGANKQAHFIIIK